LKEKIRNKTAPSSYIKDQRASCPEKTHRSEAIWAGGKGGGGGRGEK
jgi:hypothetical protein